MSYSEKFRRKTKRMYLFNIMPVMNIPSVIQYGILSYDAVKNISHDSVAMNDVQAIRDRVIIPGTNNRLHSYANPYFANNNPMMYKRKDQAEELCLLAVDYSVLDIPGVIVTDQNAASNLPVCQNRCQ